MNLASDKEQSRKNQRPHERARPPSWALESSKAAWRARGRISRGGPDAVQEPYSSRVVSREETEPRVSAAQAPLGVVEGLTREAALLVERGPHRGSSLSITCSCERSRSPCRRQPARGGGPQARGRAPSCDRPARSGRRGRRETCSRRWRPRRQRARSRRDRRSIAPSVPQILGALVPLRPRCIDSDLIFSTRWTGGDLNPYALRRRNLNPLRMPISPPVPGDSSAN